MLPVEDLVVHGIVPVIPEDRVAAVLTMEEQAELVFLAKVIRVVLLVDMPDLVVLAEVLDKIGHMLLVPTDREVVVALPLADLVLRMGSVIREVPVVVTVAVEVVPDMLTLLELPELLE
jgi:hypothetical protein